MIRNRLIGIYSPHDGSGKSSLARYLVDRHGYELIKFADPIKDMLRVLIGAHMGYEDVEEYIEGAKKEHKVCGFPFTARDLQRTLGTEWGRELYPDIWVQIAKQAVQEALDQGGAVVIDDVRFENEADMILDMGGTLVRLQREEGPTDASHSSIARLEDVHMDFSWTVGRQPTPWHVAALRRFGDLLVEHVENEVEVNG